MPTALKPPSAPGLTEADFIVKDFDDEQMIKVMDYENSSYRYSICPCWSPCGRWSSA